MPTLITIDLHSHRFRGRAADPLRSAWPPSPARVIGALLAGAHALDGADPDAPSGQCARAREALGVLVAAPPPTIYAPPRPVEMGDAITWYAPQHAVGAKYESSHAKGKALTASALGEIVAPSKLLDSGNRRPKSRTVSLLPQGTVVQYLVEADIADDTQWEALVAAAAEVPFFGASSDHATVAVARIAQTFDDPHPSITVWDPVEPAAPTPKGAVRVRCWSSETVEWFDHNYRAGGSAHGDWRVPDRIYAPRRAGTRAEPAVAEDGADVLILPLPAAITLREFARTVASVDGWKHLSVFPAVEFSRRDRVRGIGFYGTDAHAALDAAPASLLEGDFPGALVAWERRTWIGPSPEWMSITPIAAPRNATVARAEIEFQLGKRGLELVSMSAKPFMRWHCLRLGVPGNYGLWFITANADTDVTGPVQIGAHQRAGAGLLAPTVRDRLSTAT